jgi:arylsulfatase A-like enzyme
LSIQPYRLQQFRPMSFYPLKPWPLATIMAWTLTLFSLAIAPLAAKPPNILLVVSDDQRPDTIQALGNPAIRTPTLDRLVERGTSFLQAYAGYPICHASRAEILTGCPIFRALQNYPAGGIRPNLATMAGTLQRAGYTTWYCGKWHNDGKPTTRGYQGTRGLYTSGGAAKDQLGPAVDDRGHPRTGYTGWTFKDSQGRVEIGKGVGLQPTNSQHIAEGAIQAIRDTPAEKPFFVHVNFAFPHDPRQWPADPDCRYAVHDIELPENFSSEHPFDHGNIDGRDEQLLPRPRDPAAVRLELAIYYAMISDLDKQLGRILETLEESQRRDTIIFFTSDQGLALGSHGLLGKQNQYQHSIRAPLIVAGPSIPANQRHASLVMLRDIFPTLCELAGIDPPASVQGLSFAPLLRGEVTTTHRFVCGVFLDTQRMICDGTWKLIVYPKIRRTQLFQLREDPDEQRDVSGQPEYQATQAQLFGQLQSWLAAQGDPLPLGVLPEYLPASRASSSR